MEVSLDQAILKLVILARTLRPCDFTADQNLCKGANIAFAKDARTVPNELSYAARLRVWCKKLRCNSIAHRVSQMGDGVLGSYDSIVPPEDDRGQTCIATSNKVDPSGGCDSKAGRIRQVGILTRHQGLESITASHSPPIQENIVSNSCCSRSKYP